MLYLDEDVLAGSNSNEANSENTQYCTNDIATNRCNGYGYAVPPVNYQLGYSQADVVEAACFGASVASQQSINTIMMMQKNESMLKLTIDSMKSEKKFASDNYIIDCNGVGICIKPGGCRVTVGKIKITDVREYTIVKNDRNIGVIYVEYIDSKGTIRNTVFPSSKLSEKKLLAYFPGFIHCCKNEKDANGYLAWYTNNLCNETGSYHIPEYAGFDLFNSDGSSKANFICNDDNIPFSVLKYCSDNIRNKKLSREIKKIHEIIYLVKKCLDTPEKCMLYIISLCGVFSTFLKRFGIDINKIFIVSVPNDESVRYACCYMQSFNRSKPNSTYTTSKFTIGKIFSSLKDETEVVIDNTDIEDEGRRRDMTQYILDANNNNVGAHCIAVVSGLAGYEIESSKKINIHISNDFIIEKLEHTEEELCKALDFITRYLINVVCNNYEEVCTFFREKIASLKAEFHVMNKADAASYIGIVMISEFASHYLNYDFISESVTNFFNNYNSSEYQEAKDCESIIVNEFIDCLRKSVEHGVMECLYNGKGMDYNPYKSQIVIKDEYLLMSEKTVENVIMPNMKSTHSLKKIVKSMYAMDILHSTKKNRYPSTVYINGFAKRIPFIAINLNELHDEYFDRLISEGEYSKWFLNNSSEENMIPVLKNRLNEKAYQRNEFAEADNMHTFCLGQSGCGKTHALTERICSLYNSGQKVIVFDASDSFTKSAMIRNLASVKEKQAKITAEKFVNESVKFHKIENLGIPVNILKSVDECTVENVADKTFSVLTAHMGKIGNRQRALIRNGIKELAQSDALNMEALYDKFATKKMPDSSLREQYAAELSSFHEYESSNVSWKEFLENMNEITVISTKAVSETGGSALMDMMLMSLFNYQRTSNSQSVAIFLDEIQNQNLGENGPISQILKEGRKYNVSLNFATQYLPDSSSACNVLNQAALKILFQLDDNSAKKYSKLFKIDAEKLLTLEQGECFALGKFYNTETKKFKNGLIHGFTYQNFG